MATPFESAQLILKLYELRREETTRKARDFIIGFEPKSVQDIQAVLAGPQSGYLRGVISYWDMACSLVENGAIDRKMFLDASGGEMIIVFGKLEPFLEQMREMFQNPNFAIHLERVVMSIPNARQQIDGLLARIRAMLASRGAATA
jgi:hypothetical protein